MHSSIELSNDSGSLGEAFLTTSANGNVLTISGTVPTGDTSIIPGSYTLTVTSVIDGQMTAAASYALTIKPRPVGVSPDSWNCSQRRNWFQRELYYYKSKRFF